MHSSRFKSETTRALRLATIASGGPGKFLTFAVGADIYALPFLQVAEVHTLTAMTPVLNPPAYARGFVVLHGHPVPVIDLRIDFGTPAVFDRETRLIVCWQGETRRKSKMGLLVDRVTDVTEIDGAEFRRKPHLAPEADTPFVLATQVREGSRRLLLDVDSLPG